MNTQSKKPLVYFIDDDLMSLEINKKIFSKMDEDVEIAAYTNAHSALTDLIDPLKQKPELIFLDLNMPIMNGWDFIEEYNKTGLKIEIVILSSSILFEDKDKADKEEFVTEFVTKPLSKPSLMGFMHKIVGI